jgi:SAM-dependent methyltransferase
MAKHDFLCVDAIRSAIELGLVDALEGGDEIPIQDLGGARNINAVGLALLLDMLETNDVVFRRGNHIGLTARFRGALKFRDLLEARIAFADLVWPDIHALFTPLLTDLPQFMARSKVFDLFRYDRCLEVTPDNLRATSAWTRFTTVLTKYESGAALELLDLHSAATFIDLGGNTGEFARQICARYPKLRGTIVDLPVVCALGRDHIASSAAPADAERISFFSTDMRSGLLPEPADLVSFKSVLHDWPDSDAQMLLDRAAALVRPGGRLVIFERAPMAMRGKRVTYAMASDLVFLHFLRSADLYLSKVEQLGFALLEHRVIDLGIGFHFIVAQRPQ